MLSHTGWCSCRLTLEETWGLYDVPHRVVELLRTLPEATPAWRNSRRLLPGRCLEYGVRRLLAGMNGRIEGGRIMFSRGTRKRQLAELDEVDVERDPERKRPSIRFREDTIAVQEMEPV